jgi:hypothetical protein
MSSAFVKEDEEQWLHDIPPTMSALINYLSRENNGIRVSERSSLPDPANGRMVHKMSNGLLYAVDGDNRWYIVD